MDYPTITVDMCNGLTRQHRTDVLLLTIVQLAYTNKQIYRIDTDYTLQQIDSLHCTIIKDNVDNYVPRQQHIDLFYLNIVKLSCTSKLLSTLLQKKVKLDNSTKTTDRNSMHRPQNTCKYLHSAQKHLLHSVCRKQLSPQQHHE